MTIIQRLFLPFVCIVLQIPSFLAAQEKQALDHSASARWNRISGEQLSPDGRFAAWQQGPEKGDGELLVKDLESDRQIHIARGDSAQFSGDGRILVARIRVPLDSLRAAKLAKSKPEEMPLDSLVILELSSGKQTRLAGIISYKLPERGGSELAFLQRMTAAADSSGVEKEGMEGKEERSEKEEKKKGKKKKKEKKKKKRPEGRRLTVWQFPSASTLQIDDVRSYTFARQGGIMIFTTVSKDSTADGIGQLNLVSMQQTGIIRQPGNYLAAALSDDGQFAAFLSDYVTAKSSKAVYQLYTWRTSDTRKITAVPMPAETAAEWRFSENGAVRFSRSAKRLYFGIAPPALPEAKDSLPGDEKVVVDIWHWQDNYLQPMQLKELKKEQKRSYTALYDLQRAKSIPLATTVIPEVTVNEKTDCRFALGLSNLPYGELVSWEYPEYYDAYLIDMTSGKSERVLEKVQDQPALSPDGKYLGWWNRREGAWYAMSVKNRRPVNLSAALPYPVVNHLHDWPFRADGYGTIKWTAQGEALIYDQYDIWLVDPDHPGRPRNITGGSGRKNEWRYRHLSIDPEEELIDTGKPLLLSVHSYTTRNGGIARADLMRAGEPERLAFGACHYSSPRKAREAGRLLFTRENFQEFPDLRVSDLSLQNSRRISDANPQQQDYLWGSAGLMPYYSTDGQFLQGMLFKPENFDSTRQYPLLVYFYEKLSETLHRHRAPEAHRSVINITFYTSRGYLVFVPDIPYKIGYPGESAMNAVMPGIAKVLECGFADKDNIGVQGHSWGGYQIAYMVTRTSLFKAAAAGAPVSNMISAYGGIRWRSGKSRMFQYEQTQSRIGGSLWEKPLHYIENSPIFQADKITTPLLMLHNDHDGAVPWYQGIELFTALRRLGKPAWLINYNDEPHWPVKYQNKVDWQTRLQQYFDYYLKGAPAPVWLRSGIPALRKGLTLGLETEGE